MQNSLDYARQIMALLRSIQGNIKLNFQTHTQAIGITFSQVIVLLDLFRHENSSLTDLSKRLDLPKSSVSRIVDQLVNQGIVVREIPHENRRTVRLSISPDFLERKEVQRIRAGLLADIADDIEPEKAMRIISALEELDTVIKSNTHPK